MNQVEQSVAEYVDEVWEDVVADIEQLVSYPSVAVAADAEPARVWPPGPSTCVDCCARHRAEARLSNERRRWVCGHCRYPGPRR